MPRKPNTTIELAEDDQQQTETLLAHQHQVATLSAEHEANVREAAALVGYLLPADSTDVSTTAFMMTAADSKPAFWNTSVKGLTLTSPTSLPSSCGSV